ncbi:MAG: integrase [Anaerolineae bacterium]|nr:integrase [Anaerolineae bacterium]
MPTEEPMTINERRKYLKLMLPRYRVADRTERSRLLTEMQTVTTLERKSLIRLLNQPTLERQPRQRQRGTTYNHHFDDALRILAETLDYICAERLQPALLELAEHLAAHQELELTPELAHQLKHASISTVRRHLAHLNQDQPRLPRARPRRDRQAARTIPMRRIPWDEAAPGHLETDLVHHGGDTAAGDYVYTLQMVDVATGWSERVAVFGRSQRAMEAGFRRIQARIPFAILEIHPDNGSEFLNHHLIRFFHTTVKGVTLSRSRPYHKNDNRIVEQKNHTLVRAFFGDARLDTLAHQQLLDQLYDKMWQYYNLFQPVLHLAEKQRDEKAGVIRFRRRWDVARTPLERLCATAAIDEACKARLHALRAQINPRQLRAEIYALREQLFDLPLARYPQDRWLIPDTDDRADLT